ncbi:MAG TPA: MBL fold metallo-hydrolase [Alphaproteobacteria bacterium]|nr:MBL fold metallo-hydrolase [Alphaproteobacteria bacterium]
MLQWRVGDVTITKVLEFEGVFPAGGPGTMLPDGDLAAIQEISWLAPHFATPDGRIRASVHALLVETPELRLMVDTCVGNDKPRRSPAFNMLKTDFLADLEGAGWRRDSVDAVLCTHLHVDHVGWNTMLDADGRWVPTFPQARYFIGREEWEHWTGPGSDDDARDVTAILADSVRPIFDAGLVELVETNAAIAPEVRLMPTPGHTPGHVSVLIESRGERAVITGDIMHHPSQIARPHWSSDFDSDKELSRETRKAFLARFGDTPTLVIGTHFAGPTAGRLVRDGKAYRLSV